MPSRRAMILAMMMTLSAVAGCSTAPKTEPKMDFAAAPLYPNETPELRRLINKWADHYELPPRLVHRLAIRESTHQPKARSGPYWGLLQILPQTARSMGFSGSNEDLLNPDVNLEYGLKYLRGAYLVADGDESEAIQWYAKGYYYEAKRKGLLEESGLR